jgi:hypothetical protein
VRVRCRQKQASLPRPDSAAGSSSPHNHRGRSENQADRREELLAELGKHKTGKACLYIKRTADINLDVLERLVEESVAETRRRYP